MTLTDEQIAELLALEEKATPGPWKRDNNFGCKAIKGGKSGKSKQAQYHEVACTPGLYREDEDAANADLIAAARNHLRAALLELQERRRKVQTVKHTDCLCCYACECGYSPVARQHLFCPGCGHEIERGGK